MTSLIIRRYTLGDGHTAVWQPRNDARFYVCQENANYAVKEMKSQFSDARMDPKFCPHAPNIIAFVRYSYHLNATKGAGLIPTNRNGDLWVVDTDNQKEKRLTFSRNGIYGMSSSRICSSYPISIPVSERDTLCWHSRVCDARRV